jgi:hypothetical protein
MKPVKITLRIWIAVTSILSFLGGWALLSHSGKPVSIFASSTDTNATGSGVSVNTTLPPIPSLDQLVGSSTGAASNSTFQSLPAQSSSSFNFAPSFRSRGS